MLTPDSGYDVRLDTNISSGSTHDPIIRNKTIRKIVLHKYSAIVMVLLLVLFGIFDIVSPFPGAASIVCGIVVPHGMIFMFSLTERKIASQLVRQFEFWYLTMLNIILMLGTSFTNYDACDNVDDVNRIFVAVVTAISRICLFFLDAIAIKPKWIFRGILLFCVGYHAYLWAKGFINADCAVPLEMCFMSCYSSLKMAQTAVFTILLFFVKYLVAFLMFPTRALILKASVNFEVPGNTDDKQSEEDKQSVHEDLEEGEQSAHEDLEVQSVHEDLEEDRQSGHEV